MTRSCESASQSLFTIGAQLSPLNVAPIMMKAGFSREHSS